MNNEDVCTVSLRVASKQSVEWPTARKWFRFGVYPQYLTKLEMKAAVPLQCTHNPEAFLFQ